MFGASAWIITLPSSSVRSGGASTRALNRTRRVSAGWNGRSKVNRPQARKVRATLSFVGAGTHQFRGVEEEIGREQAPVKRREWGRRFAWCTTRTMSCSMDCCTPITAAKPAWGGIRASL